MTATVEPVLITALGTAVDTAVDAAISVVPTPAVRGTGAQVAVVGLGYVGLPTALALAGAGQRVLGIDTSDVRRAAIADLDVDLLERDRLRLAEVAGTDLFRVDGDPARLAEADVVIVCVPTPVDDHLVPDLAALRGACATVVEHARPGQLLILTSTTYVGTTRDLLIEPLVHRGLRPGFDVNVAFSPERIDPGNAQFPVERTPRVVGGHTPACLAVAADFLALTAPLVHAVSSCEAAEMAKLHENTFRAVNIAYVNEIADVCESMGLDPIEVIDAAASKPYGFMAFRPGPGVGGHCIPCDPHYLLWQLKQSRIEAPVVDAAMRAIAARPGSVVTRVRDRLADSGTALRTARVLVLGVTYKPGVADIRESPALEILEALSRAGTVVGYLDPFVSDLEINGKVLRSQAKIDADEWDLVVVHTAHPGLPLAELLGRVPVLDATYSIGGR